MFRLAQLLKLLCLTLFLVFTLCGCTAEKGLILFNSVPINQNNALHDKKIFKEGSKVYYLFIAPNKMDNEFIRVQVFKTIENAPYGGNDVVRTKDFRLMKDQKYYYTDYFTFYEKGRYIMQVFSHDDFNNPIGINEFYIK